MALTVIAYALASIGELSDEAAESNNKNIKQYRLNYTRKISRIATNTDLMHRLLLSSDSFRNMVEICSSYDETRMLLSRQRRIPIPHTALLEPNFATPSTPKQSTTPQVTQRFGRAYAIEEDNLNNSSVRFQDTEDIRPYTQENMDLDGKIDNSLKQVNALRLQIDNRSAKSTQQYQNRSNLGEQRPITNPTKQREETQVQQQWQRRATQLQQTINTRQSERPIVQPSEPSELPRSRMVCWNCDENDHRFLNCPEPQVMLFCYRCGRKGYTLRNCFTCRTDAGNASAGNRQ